jgi:hypothetical protein
VSDKHPPDSCIQGLHEWKLASTRVTTEGLVKKNRYRCTACPARAELEPGSDYGSQSHPNQITTGHEPKK